MNEKLAQDHSLLKAYLEHRIEEDKTRQDLVIQDDEDYEILYSFRYTPCCIPLDCLVWINPVNDGLFLRCFFPKVTEDYLMDKLIFLCNRINVKIPSGCFAVNPESREVVFKNAFYYGKMNLTGPLVNHFFGSSLEFVKKHWEEILSTTSGGAWKVHNH